MSDGGRFRPRWCCQIHRLRPSWARYRTLTGPACCKPDGSLAGRAGSRWSGGRPGGQRDRAAVGVVKIQKLTGHGEEVVLGISGPGDLLGEIAAVRDAPRSASAIALESVTGVVIAVSALRRFLLDHPSTTLALLDLSLRRLHAADERRLEFATRTTLTRVASRLVELTNRFGETGRDGAIEVALAINQEELASWSASSLESTARALRTLRQLGAIETRRLRLIVRDPSSCAPRPSLTATAATTQASGHHRARRPSMPLRRPA